MEKKKFEIPAWAFEFHGHNCPFMPIGYRMGTLALQKMGVERCKDNEMHVFSEMGIGHPQTCMQDGIMASIGATFGKSMIDRLYYGKIAATFWYPGKVAVRIVLKNEFSIQATQRFIYKGKCEICGEYVFERYLRHKDGKNICIPCSGYEADEKSFYIPQK